MPLFGKRKSAGQPVPQQQTVDQRALEEAQSDFSAGFKTWLDGVGRAQAETGAGSLSHEILDRVGAVPQPQGSTTLNRTQLIFLQSYARTYATRIVEHHRTTAVVAAAEAERDGAEHSLQLQIAAEYWDTVEAYVVQMLA